MQEIKSIADLESLRRKIIETRKKCKERPDLEKGTFLQQLFDRVPPLRAECNAHNEQQYSTLPKEMIVTPEMGQLLLSLFLAHAKAEQDVEKKLPTTEEAIVGGVKYLLTGLFPNPLSITEMLYDTHNLSQKIDDYSQAMDELIRKADRNMYEILGSYQLAKDNEGNFVLKRGTWFTDSYLGPAASFRGNNPEIWYTAVKDVGVNRDLVPADQRYLIDRYSQDSRRSPNIGLWENEQQQRHRF